MLVLFKKELGSSNFKIKPHSDSGSLIIGVPDNNNTLQFAVSIFSYRLTNVFVWFLTPFITLWNSSTITRELFWFDYENWQTITPPKSILKYFKQENELRKVGWEFCYRAVMISIEWLIIVVSEVRFL